MAETNDEKQYPTEGFHRAYTWFTVNKGMVLVKKSGLTGRIFAKGSYSKETVQAPAVQKLYLHTLPDSMLAKLENKFASNPRYAEDLAKVRKEINFRNANGADPETPELASATVLVKGMSKPDIIRRKISAKLGIKFRWPWQSVMAISLGSFKIDTPPISINTVENLQIKFDSDYSYHISDPVAYATTFNSLAESRR